jgi:ABC-type Zn2+ transport system substrate-binding protein/surface adhesin
MVNMVINSWKKIFNKPLLLLLIALVLYFSQVYPYTHYHHVHSESDEPIEKSTHQNEVEPSHVHHGHDHDDSPHQSSNTHHHDHEFDQHVDWHLVRTYSNSIQNHFDFVYISIQADITSTTSFSSLRYRADKTILPESALLDGIDSRGPPIFG